MAAFAAVKKIMKEHKARSGVMPYPGPDAGKKSRKRLFEKKPLDTSL